MNTSITSGKHRTLFFDALIEFLYLAVKLGEVEHQRRKVFQTVSQLAVLDGKGWLMTGFHFRCNHVRAAWLGKNLVKKLWHRCVNVDIFIVKQLF